MGLIWVKMGQNGVKLGSKWVKRLATQLTHPPKKNRSKWVKMESTLGLTWGQNGSIWVKMGRNRAAMAKIV